MLAAGLVRTPLLEKLEKAKEANRRRPEAISSATSTGTFTAQARKSSALEFHSRNTHARMHIRSRCIYIY